MFYSLFLIMRQRTWAWFTCYFIRMCKIFFGKNWCWNFDWIRGTPPIRKLHSHNFFKLMIFLSLAPQSFSVILCTSQQLLIFFLPDWVEKIPEHPRKLGNVYSLTQLLLIGYSDQNRKSCFTRTKNWSLFKNIDISTSFHFLATKCCFCVVLM